METNELTDDQRARLDGVRQLTAEGNEQYHAGDFADAAPLYHQALATMEEVLGPEHPSVADPLINLANLYYVQEKYVDAEAAYLRALSLLEQDHGHESFELAYALTWLAETRFRSQKYEEAKEPYRRAVAILDQENDVERLADALMRLAHLHYFIGEYAEAEPFYLRALALREEHLGPDHLTVAHSAGQLARMYYLHPEFGKDAEPLFGRALAIREKVQGPDHPDVAQSLYRLADCCRGKNRFDEAEPLYSRAMSILDSHPELSWSDTSWMRSGYAKYLRETGREPEADALEKGRGGWNAYEDLLRAQVEKREKTLGPEHPDYAASIEALAHSCFFERKYDEAEEFFMRALRIREKVLDPEHPDIAESLNGLAKLYRVRQRYEEAGELLDRAAAIQEQAFGQKSAGYAYTLEHQALLAEALGQPTRAEELFRSALAIYKEVSGEQSREYAETLFHFVVFYIRQEQFAEADAVSAELLRVAESEIDDVSELEKADYLEVRAVALENLERMDEAEGLRAKVQEIWAESNRKESSVEDEDTF